MSVITRRTFGKLLGLSAGSYLVSGVAQQPQGGWINLPKSHIDEWLSVKGYLAHIYKDRPESPDGQRETMWHWVEFLTPPEWHTQTYTVNGRSESYVYCLGSFAPNQPPAEPGFRYNKGGVSLYLPERRVARISLTKAV